MNIYILRHGQTDYNVEGKFQGQIDIEMNNVGESQTDEIAIELNQVKFDFIFSSPLNRALKTAKKINSANIKIDARIIERSFGSLEGKNAVSDYEKNIKFYKIETMQDLEKRVYEFLEEIMLKCKNKENILIVTHEGVAQIINKYLGRNIENFRLSTGKYVKYII